MGYKAAKQFKKVKELPADCLQAWKNLGDTISELMKSGASAKEVGSVIVTDQEFSQRVVQLAGCKMAAMSQVEQVVRAVVLLGMQRVTEVAQSQEIWRQIGA